MLTACGSSNSSDLLPTCNIIDVENGPLYCGSKVIVLENAVEGIFRLLHSFYCDL